MHPQIRSIFHERFLLTKYKTVKSLRKHIKGKNINFDKENWGDKTPYYPNIRKIQVGKYCKTWTEFCGEDSRILNIFRHPYDIAFSIDYKYRHQTFEKAIGIYRKRILSSLRETLELPNAMVFKYEDLILNPSKLVPDIYNFCGLDDKVDFIKLMKNWEQKKYQSFDKSRVFAYKNKKIPKFKMELDDIITELNNKLEGPKYKL